MSERHAQHSHLTMGGTHPPPSQKGPTLTSTGMIRHTIYHPNKVLVLTSIGIAGHTIYYPYKGIALIYDPIRKAQHLYLTQLERLSTYILWSSTTHHLLSKERISTYIYWNSKTHHLLSRERNHTYILWHSRTHHLLSKERICTYIH